MILRQPITVLSCLPVLTRIPGLRIRECARSSNRCLPRCTKVSAIDVTVKTICERWYLVPVQGKFGQIWALSQLSVWSHPPTAYSPAISQFLCNSPNSEVLITHRQRHKPRAYQRQRYKPCMCQSMLNTLQVDRMARITSPMIQNWPWA